MMIIKVTRATVKVLAAAALAAAALTGCGTATQSYSRPTATPAPSQTASANVQVCQDYAKQRAWVKAHKATLTLVDDATIGGWLEVDVAASTGKLHTDLTAESDGYQRALSNEAPTASQKTAYRRVSNDCSSIG